MSHVKHALLASLSAATLLQLACSTAEGDVIATAPPPRVPTPAPYHVELMGEDGSVLPTYAMAGRLYTLGNAHERYTIRVTNPTGQRVEAVISVDGLDAIDGTSADFVHKRGYVIPPYGEIRLEGFRVSVNDVAAFRFSSVRDSYAGRKGQARNVGVIGVAIFAERAQPEVYIPEDELRRRPVDHPDYYNEEGRAPSPPPSGDREVTEKDKRSASKAPAAEPGVAGGERGPASPPPTTATAPNRRYEDDRCCGEAQQKERPGLGTEFGERRYSRVAWTRFERASSTRPTAMAEIRYNDRDGLAALGIPIDPTPGPDELDLRETANPFPGSPYASPPPGWTR